MSQKILCPAFGRRGRTEFLKWESVLTVIDGNKVSELGVPAILSFCFARDTEF